MRATLLANSTAMAAMAFCLPALATFHLIKIVEVFAGTAASPNAQYVVLEMYASGQNLVGGRSLTLYNNAGTLIGTVTFPGNVANGNNQARILLATGSAESFFGLTADLHMAPCSTVTYFQCVPWVFAKGGKLCWSGSLDCIAWGDYSAGTAGIGTPFRAAGGLKSGEAVVRRLDIAGSATVLDAGDDTDNSANDFVPGMPAPRNNAGARGTIPGATCGNGVIDGLEQCDDHNLTDGDGCSSTCASGESLVTHRVGSDFNGDGSSDVLWRNTGTGANVIWRSGKASTKQAMSAVTNQSWKISGTGDFNGDGESDVLWRNASTGANTIWHSASSISQQAVTTVADLHWTIAGVGDFDDDGNTDVLWRNVSTGANVVWKSANSGTRQSIAGVTNQAWHVVGVDDFDGDGRADIFWRNINSGSNSIWKSGNAATAQSVTGVSNLSWKTVGFGDFDGDGDADVFWRNTSTGANAIWRSAVAATQLATAAIADQAWQVALIGDFNADGKADVFWRNGRTGANGIWSAGSGTAPQSVTGVTELAWRIVPYEGQLPGP